MRRILVFVDNFDVGGVTSVVKIIYRNLDRTRFQMDFVRKEAAENEFDREIKRNGDKVYCFRDVPLNKIPVYNYAFRCNRIIRQLESIIEKNQYDVIHIHAHASVGLIFAKKMHIPVRIMHTHEAIPDFGENVTTSRITNFIWKYRQYIYNKIPTVKAGDSLKACKVKYGENVTRDDRLCVLYPPVDSKRFNPALYDRHDVLKKYEIDPSVLNVIHVGRLNPVKNQVYLIDIIYEINKVRPCMLYVIGEGLMYDQIMNRSKELGVMDKVKVLPPDTSPEIYLGMDCSILPSLSEAFGMVAVESQVMKVPCFASTNVAQETDIGLCKFLSLDIGANNWAKEIIACSGIDFQYDAERMSQFTENTLNKKVELLYAKE